MLCCSIIEVNVFACQSHWRCKCHKPLGKGYAMSTPPLMSDIVNQIATAAA